jgi:hypothetical protein
VLKSTPWTGYARPGKVAVSPKMEILAYWTGVSNKPGLDAIKAHKAANP